MSQSWPEGVDLEAPRKAADEFLGFGKRTVDGRELRVRHANARAARGRREVMKADSREAAIEPGRRFMQIHADVEPSLTGELEIREMLEAPMPHS